MYALGGGFGHAVRGSALAAALQRRGIPAKVLLPKERGWLGRNLGADTELVEHCGTPSELRAKLDSVFADVEHLIVDALPLGVLGELTGLLRGRRTTLLARLFRADLLDPFRRSLQSYDRVVDLEPELDWLSVPRVQRLGPVVYQRPTVAVDAAPELDVCVLADDAELHRFGGRLVARLARHGVLARLWSHAAHPELIDLAAISPKVVVGPAGYNLTYEARSLGVHHIALPRPRRFDDQRRRARSVAELPSSPETLEQRVLSIVRDGAEPRRAGPSVSPDALAVAVVS